MEVRMERGREGRKGESIGSEGGRKEGKAGVRGRGREGESGDGVVCVSLLCRVIDNEKNVVILKKKTPGTPFYR